MQTKISQEDSLRIISDMISTARGNLQEGAGKYFILWGYLVFLSSAAHFLLNMYADPRVEGYGVVWLGTMLVGVVITLIMAYRDSKTSKVYTYTDSIVRYIWIGFLVCLIAIMVLLNGKLGWYTYPAISFTYTFALYISAVVYRFKWMYISVIICFLCTIAYKFIPMEYYALLMATAMLVGNIMPGHYINYKAKQQNNV